VQFSIALDSDVEVFIENLNLLTNHMLSDNKMSAAALKDASDIISMN